MKKLTLIAAAAAFSASAVAAQDVVRMGTEGAYPPFNFINDDNELEGFEIDLGNEMCERAGLTCEWVINDWDTIIPNLVAGNYDTIIAGMSITEARSEIISFTQNYKEPDPSRYAALIGTGDDVIDSGVIATQSNTVQAGFVAESDADLIEFPTPDETIAAVRAGEADAVLADGDFLRPIVEESSDLEFIGEPMHIGGGVGMGLRQSDNELRETFDAVITEMKEDGSLNELLIQWFGEDTPTF
ncbi:transporter substrate-binding domain-containing protein [Rhodobacteraceae bacterium 2376]|uniref:Transporter substrate-binding domain-containing protein n=1 Tax=Rhabdonatronobacter sediminivivens TaxID=2743469 RepID=A0A7Z0I0P1_9RHOB|nr:transporter substrate-binding domain-containing protein [Rhabdonatronobacter sediminivivens]NYS25705.1 transporter substrate-binding domain-containing protein [Rhabdonatronobacter sediminivivens]